MAWGSPGWGMSLSRRAFVASAAAASLAAPAVLRGQAAEDRAVGFAVIGLGSFAINQMLPAFAQCRHARPTALVTGDPDGKGRRVAERYGIDPKRVVTYDRIQELADDPAVQVGYVVTPTGLHARDTLACFDAGLHVLCEKPMAGCVEECDRMIGRAEEVGRRLMVAYRVHYEPFNRTAMRFAEREEFGATRHVAGQISYPMSGEPTWRNDPELAGGGGPLMDLGIYTLQAQLYNTPQTPVWVTGTTHRPEGDRLFPEGIESRCSWTIDFDGGATATGMTGYDLASTNRYRVTQADGWYELDPATAYSGRRLFTKPPRGRAAEVPMDDLPTELTRGFTNQFAAELDHMATCVLDGSESRTPGAMGRRDVRLMKAIYESAATGRPVEV